MAKKKIKPSVERIFYDDGTGIKINGKPLAEVGKKEALAGAKARRVLDALTKTETTEQVT